jgi:hypothetical protein
MAESPGSATVCDVCNEPVTGSVKVGVRGAGTEKSGVWEFNQPCGHKIEVAAPVAAFATYQGGPLWQAGYKWQSIYWGSYWKGASLPFTPAQVDRAVLNIENDASYSGGLSEYSVGQGTVLPSVVISDPEPPSTIDDSAIGPQIAAWIAAGMIPDLGAQGAYNIFFPPGVTVTLQGSSSCAQFCDYHNYDGTHFYTVEPYPCAVGCNQCTGSEFDTLTQGLSEEMIELKTDMNPGTGWIIGNEELCDYCDSNFKCNQIATGEYVNAWYSDAMKACWLPQQGPPPPPPPPPPGNPCLALIQQGVADLEGGNDLKGLEEIVGGIECYLSGQGFASHVEGLMKEEAKSKIFKVKGRLAALREKISAVAGKLG